MSTLISLVAFVCFFAAGLAGMRLRTVLPEEHLADDSRHLLETALGIIGTVGGLVLGLLVGTAFGSFNAERNAIVQLSANVVVLDRILAHYGPQSATARAALRDGVEHMIDEVWPSARHAAQLAPDGGASEKFVDALEALDPKSTEQTSLKGAATGIALSIAQTRWQMYAQAESGISPAIIALLIFWFSITFVGLGIFTRTNPTVIATLLLAALALSGAIYILEEMSSPFQGAIHVSSTPLREALAHLGK